MVGWSKRKVGSRVTSGIINDNASVNQMIPIDVNPLCTKDVLNSIPDVPIISATTSWI